MLETEPQLEETYVADGQVRLIFKHYPLPSHALADEAAEAAECAAQQGGFWELKKLLFEKSGEWGAAADPLALFQTYAEEVGLDVDAFVACYDSGAGRARWQQDAALGQAIGVQGTPNFFVIRLEDRTGTAIPGFIEFGQFQSLLEQILAAPPASQ